MARGYCWLYYKLRTASGTSREIERVITDVVPEIVRSSSFERWFFLRYSDTGGLHLRLRLMARAAEQAAAVSSVDSALRKWTDGIDTAGLSISTVDVDTYEPETWKFGERGILIAEAVFQASSEAALHTLAGEREGRCSRKTLAPIYMKCVADAFVSEESHSMFWERYASYWLDGKPDQSEAWRRLFHSKADELRARGVPVLGAMSGFPGPERECIERWSAALREAAGHFAELQEEQARRRSDLAFHFVHLMSNRLGVRPVAESYFATLLARQEAETAL